MNPLHLLGKLVPDDSDIGDMARRFVAYALIVLLVFAVVGAIVFVVARFEYYRGIYDVCMAYAEDFEWCAGMVQFAIDNGWQMTKSGGWYLIDYNWLGDR